MEKKIIKREDIESLLPLFAKNYPGVELNDELKYFDELKPNDWYLFEIHSKAIGYIRHFPDPENDFSPIEYYFDESISEAERINILVSFCEDAAINHNLRLDLKLHQKKYIDKCSKVLTKKVQLNFFEKNLDYDGNVLSTKLSSKKDCMDIIEIFKSFGTFKEDTIDSWIENNSCYSFEFDNKLIGACYVRSHQETIEIEMISILENFRNKGLGEKFLKELFVIFKNEGYQKVFLKVKKANLSAVRLYEKCGMNLIEMKSEVWLYHH